MQTCRNNGKSSYTIDELTGLINATALMRPTGISDMKIKSVKKNGRIKLLYRVNKELLQKAELLGMNLDKIIEETIKGMQKIAENWI